MSRSGYSDDYGDDDPLALGRYRSAVRSAINGKRGQAALRETLAALDAMPKKVLIGESLVTADGEFCTLGVLGAARGIDMSGVDPEDSEAVAKLFGIADSMVREIVYENDEVLSRTESVAHELCGPVRPYYPEYGEHRRWAWGPVEDIEHKRWKHMREWVAAHIKQDPAP